MAKKKDKTGREMERLVADLYRRMGAFKVEHDVEMGGHQIDVYVELPTWDHSVDRIAVQAKDWSGRVGINDVGTFQRVVKPLRDANLVDEGVMVSLVGFSKPGRNGAKTYGIRLLEIQDLELMADRAEKGLPLRGIEPTVPLSPEPYFAHPYPMQPHFTGRVNERKMLTEWLTTDSHPVFTVIAIGGMGKSALTWAWVQCDVLGLSLPDASEDKCESECAVPEDKRPEGVLWWSFYERESSFEAFRAKALIYTSHGHMDPSTMPSAYEKAEALASQLQQHRFLLVLDGFERELRAYAGLSAAYQGDEIPKDAQADLYACIDPHAGEFLRRLANPAVHSRVLITSRLFPREMEDLACSRSKGLKAMDPDDALLFFQAQGIRCTRAEVDEACAPYGYHPLALRLLAGVIVKDKRTPGDIRVANRYPVLPDLKGKEQHHILQVAYDTLDKENRELLSRIAAFRSPVTYDTLSGIGGDKNEEQLDTALDDLIERGLLFHDREGNLYDLHPIVRQYAYERLADKKGFHTRLRDYFAAVPMPDEDKVESIDDLAPVIELYHHTIGAGLYDEASQLFRGRLGDVFYFHLAAYSPAIQLLRALFRDGEDHAPPLTRKDAQSWAFNELGRCYGLTGRSRSAILLFEKSNELDEEQGTTASLANLTTGLRSLGHMHVNLGALRAAEGSVRQSIKLSRDIGGGLSEANGHQSLGRILGYEGDFSEAATEAAAGMEFSGYAGDPQALCVAECQAAICALLIEDVQAALDASRRALRLAQEAAETIRPVERDFVQAHFLIGASLTALAAEGKNARTRQLNEAETHLTEALTRCRRINLMEMEADILLSWARWHRALGSAEATRDTAEGALRIADRCEYRLKQADIHNFLALLGLEAGNREAAIAHAQKARERAWCDGPPHCYKPALDEADRLLAQLGACP